MSVFKYVKKAKKSKCVVYILRDFDGNIIDATDNDVHHTKYIEPNGNELTEVQIQQLDYKARYQSGIKTVNVKVTDEGYEKEHPFVFDADFEIVGTTGGASYDALEFGLIDGLKVDRHYDWQTKDIANTARKFAITTHNYFTLLELIKNKDPNFGYIIRQNYDPVYWNNLEVKGVRGRWVFEFNKCQLAVKPYVEKED